MKLGSSKVISNTLRVVIWLRSDQSLSRKGEKVEFIYLKERKISHVFVRGFIVVHGN